MAQFDDTMIIQNDGMLAVNEQDDSSHIEQKQIMLHKELEKFNSLNRPILSSSNIITTILDEISGELNIQLPGGHNMTCHNKSHGSTGGGTGFSKSHDKRC